MQRDLAALLLRSGGADSSSAAQQPRAGRRECKAQHLLLAQTEEHSFSKREVGGSSPPEKANIDLERGARWRAIGLENRADVHALMVRLLHAPPIAAGRSVRIQEVS
jgi:hypothetical protein